MGLEANIEVSALRYSGAAGLHGRSPLLRLQSDERLVTLIRRGNQSAFEALVGRYHSRLLSFCRHLLGSREDAEDVLQDVLAASYTALLADERPINVRPWLYRIARNRCLNHLRRNRAVGVDSMDIHLSENGATTADKAHDREEFRQLLDDIRDLPETQRTALVLREMDALSYEQIAEAMETTVSSVKSLLVRARVSLTESAAARLLSCEEVREELAEVAEGLRRKSSAPVRRHIKNCSRCGVFQGEIRNTNRALAVLAPVGPLVLLRKLLFAHFLGHSAGAASAGAASAGSASAGAASAGAASASAGAASAGAVSAGAAGAGAGSSGLISAGVGAVATKAAAGIAAAALVTATVAVGHAPKRHHGLAARVLVTRSLDSGLQSATTSGVELAGSVPTGPVHRLAGRRHSPAEAEAAAEHARSRAAARRLTGRHAATVSTGATVADTRALTPPQPPTGTGATGYGTDATALAATPSAAAGTITGAAGTVTAPTGGVPPAPTPSSTTPSAPTTPSATSPPLTGAPPTTPSAASPPLTGAPTTTTGTPTNDPPTGTPTTDPTSGTPTPPPTSPSPPDQGPVGTSPAESSPASAGTLPAPAGAASTP